MAEYLLEHDMIDFIGTDMHNLKHATVIEEYLHSKDYRKHADKLKDRIFNDLAF
jgi:tyrosine-protein phosphatase YwqE